jgi:hypothetical protein
MHLLAFTEARELGAMTGVVIVVIVVLWRLFTGRERG